MEEEGWEEAACVTRPVGGVESLFCPDSDHRPITGDVRRARLMYQKHSAALTTTTCFLLSMALHRKTV